METTDLVFILDRSGSMHGLEADTIGGFNGMLEKQRTMPGDCRVTTVLFDDEIEALHDRKRLEDVTPLTEGQYYVRGCTALLDAVGETIMRVDRAQRSDFAGRPNHTVFVITTDGMENASQKFTQPQVKSLIEEHKTMNWEFIFLGASIDAVATAAGIGIHADRAATYVHDSVGTSKIFEAAEAAVEAVRCCMPMGASWKSGVEADYAKRG